MQPVLDIFWSEYMNTGAAYVMSAGNDITVTGTSASGRVMTLQVTHQTSRLVCLVLTSHEVCNTLCQILHMVTTMSTM